MLFGRIVGWLMVLGGAFLLFIQGEWVNIVRSAGGMPSWDYAAESGFGYMSRALAESISAVLDSQWTALVLIVLGLLMGWVCRRGPGYH